MWFQARLLSLGHQWIVVGTKTHEIISHIQKTMRIKRTLYKTKIKFEMKGLKKAQTLKDLCDDKSSRQSWLSKFLQGIKLLF